eukprot:6969179-Heterocapsa_arctica.AAC.1
MRAALQQHGLGRASNSTEWTTLEFINTTAAAAAHAAWHQQQQQQHLQFNQQQQQHQPQHLPH